MAKAKDAATRLVKESSASESNPTEPVTHQAPHLNTMVTAAAPIESHRAFYGVRAAVILCQGSKFMSLGRISRLAFWPTLNANKFNQDATDKWRF